MSKGRRQLTSGERSLWNTIARTVTPIHSTVAPSAAPTGAVPPAVAQRAAKAAKETPRPKAAGSPINSGDPRRAQLVGRGRLAIDAVIDLHGMRQHEADRATSAFIAKGVQRGHRVLLIITGKGSKAGEHGGRGVIRQGFLQQMELGAYGPGVASVRTAHQRHGGHGAFYVFLRSAKRTAKSRQGVTKTSREISSAAPMSRQDY
ncbi:MAG: Smr/MutS family protein [Pseudomonadota bacterium]